MPMWGYMNSYGMGGILWGTLSMLMLLIVFGLLIWGLLSLIERRTYHRLTSGQPPSALETLGQRYARGEIDEATFQRMREQLAAHSFISPPEPTLPTR